MSAKPCIMPTDCEPCPGKTMASVMGSISREDGAPGEAAAHALHQNKMAGAHAAVTHGDVEGEWNGSGRRVGVPVHRDDALRFGQAELLRDVREDANVGLVRDVGV